MPEPVIVNDSAKIYEFEGFRFLPAERTLVRLRDGYAFRLLPKATSLLLLLIEREGGIASYEEIKKVVWAETPDISQHTIHETKRSLVQTFGVGSAIVETVTGKGYRLNAEVVVISGTETSTGGSSSQIIPEATRLKGSKEEIRDFACGVSETAQELKEVEDKVKNENGAERTVSSAKVGFFGGHARYVLTICTMYAALYTLALFVEIGYEFDRFGRTATEIAPAVFFWVFLTSLYAMHSASRGGVRGDKRSLAFAAAVFIFSAFLLYAALCLFLPGRPITQANFQTYTAPGAYLKSVGYFLFLAGFFILLPFHIICRQRAAISASERTDLNNSNSQHRDLPIPDSPILLRPRWLGVTVIALALVSPALAAHLFDNLRVSPYTNLFMQLVE